MIKSMMAGQGMGNIDTRSIGDKLKDTAYLLKNSFTIVGKDEDIKTPAIKMAILSFICKTIFFLSLFFFFFGIYASNPTLIWIGVGGFILDFFLGFYKVFYNMRQKANLSWIVYNTLKGEDVNYQQAHAHTKQNKGFFRKLALIQILVDFATSNNKKNKKKGILGGILSLVLRAIEEIWDLLKHFMLPSVVIENKHFKESMEDIKCLKKNVPATFAGVLGIDFAGDIVKKILVPVYILFIALAVGVGYLVGLLTEFTTITVAEMTISWVPVVIMSYIIFLIGGVLKVIVDSVKVIYFTILYTAIQRPMEIQESMRDELTHYILMKPKDSTEQNKANPSANSNEGQATQGKVEQNTAAEQNNQASSPEHQQYIQQLAAFINKNLQQNQSKEEITKFLISKGYPETHIQEAFNSLYKNN